MAKNKSNKTKKTKNKAEKKEEIKNLKPEDVVIVADSDEEAKEIIEELAKEGDVLPETNTEVDFEAKKEKSVYVYIRDINFGQHKPGEIYKGNDHKALLAKKLIEKQ